MGRDKALIELDGLTLLQRTVDFCSSFADEILISSNSSEHQIEGIQRVEDEIKDCGPIGGIYSSLKNSANNWNLILSVDAPYIQKDFIHFLEINTGQFEAVVPVYDGKKEPLIALYHKKALPQIETKINEGNYKLHFLLEELNTNFVEVGEWLQKYPRLFTNLNFPEDLIS